MITTLRSALSTVGGVVDRLIHHDYTAAEAHQHDLKRAKRLKLTIPTVANGEASQADEKTNLSSGFPHLPLDAFRKPLSADAIRLGANSLPSPPLSPTKRDATHQPVSKSRRLFGKFRLDTQKNFSVTDFNDGSSTARSILPYRTLVNARRRFHSRPAPKRLARTRLPMPVRFTESTERPKRSKRVPEELPALHKLNLDTEPTVSTPAQKQFGERLLSPSPETFDYIPALATVLLAESPINPDECIDAILNEKPLWTLDLNSSVEEAIKAQRKTQVASEEITREHVTNMHMYDVRPPLRPLLTALSDEIKKRTASTIFASPDAVLAKAADSTPLRRHDFCRVIPHKEWLNDEIVNGVLSWLDQAVNHIGGVDDHKAQTRKCLVMTSFYYKQIKMACRNTQRTLKRKAITKENLLKVNTILLPICEHSHWTLMVIHPSKRQVAHVDSLNPRGTKSVTDLALRWMEDALGEHFIPGEWSTIKYNHPAQTNGYDCGVHTICNAICIAMGVDALRAYKATEMPALRLQMSAVLVNGGFVGELDLLGL